MNAVETHNIGKTFGDIRALDGVSIQFEEGIVYGLLGPNGAGKTTLIRVLTTLLKPDSGSASVVGVDLVVSFGIDKRQKVWPVTVDFAG